MEGGDFNPRHINETKFNTTTTTTTTTRRKWEEGKGRVKKTRNDREPTTQDDQGPHAARLLETVISRPSAS